MLKNRSLFLLVDDDLTVDFLHKRLLVKAGVVSPIVTLYNGRQAVEELLKLNLQLNKEDNILILLDINMPILDGWGFLAELNQIYTTLNYKIELFVVSSSNNPDDLLKAKQNQYVNGYINKPLSMENIINHFA